MRVSHGERRHGGGVMRRLVMGGLLVGVAALAYQTLPDIVRYLRMREM